MPGVPANPIQLSVHSSFSLALSKKRRLDSESRSVMKVGRGWAGREVGMPVGGQDTKAISQRQEACHLRACTLDAAMVPAFPQKPEIPPLEPLTFALVKDADRAAGDNTGCNSYPQGPCQPLRPPFTVQ